MYKVHELTYPDDNFGFEYQLYKKKERKQFPHFYALDETQMKALKSITNDGHEHGIFISKPLAIGISASDIYDSIGRTTHYEVLVFALVLSKKVIRLQSVRSTGYERRHQALPELPVPQVVVARI